MSSNTAYIESASGVGDGARTGLASIVTGLAFLVAMFLAPLAQIVPFEAATPVLVLVGLMMLRSAVDLDWRDYRIAVPAFLTIIVMPFGYSIAAGIGVGFIAYVVINAFTGKAKEVKPLMWVAAAAFVIYFAMPGPQTLFDQLAHPIRQGRRPLRRRPFALPDAVVTLAARPRRSVGRAR